MSERRKNFFAIVLSFLVAVAVFGVARVGGSDLARDAIPVTASADIR